MNPLFIFFYGGLVLSLAPSTHSAFTPRHLQELKNRSKSLFHHGWHSYMDHAFPADEVRPISCVPYGPQFTTPDDIHRDALGNVSSTVLDNLDTLIMMQEWAELRRVLEYLHANQDGYFDQDNVIQVFEASIRWLGGLLSAHLALSELDWHSGDPEIQKIATEYDGFLLNMAYDLGLRLIPAYKTSTGLPLPRINLAKGLDAVSSKVNKEACTAGATTPFLEFTLLSRLTGDPRFETLTRSTLDKLWDARSPIGLLPMSLDPHGGKWLDVITGIGASIDSFYEYALKGAIVLDDSQLWDIFAQSYQSLVTFSAMKSGPDGFTYFANIQATTADLVATWIDSLSAFWPGLQVLAGRLTDAVSSHIVYLKIWDHFDSIPERWETRMHTDENLTPERKLDFTMWLEWYPLRPEFIESTYYLYRATREPMYLEIGVRILELFETRFKAECGFSGYQSIKTGSMQDRMETFVLGESLKYLYLLFDESNDSYVHSPKMTSKNWVFSTEAHPLWLTKEMQTRSKKQFFSFLKSQETPSKTLSKVKGKKSMWRGVLQASNEMDSDPEDLIAFDHSSMIARFDYSLEPAFNHLTFCEIKPNQWDQERRFLGSGYYEWNRLFTPNEIMGKTLFRPAHLKPIDGDGIIELSDSFLQTYGLSPNKFCSLSATTAMTEVQIGALKRPEQYEMYRVTGVNLALPFAVSDIVMPELSGRFRVEHLQEHLRDSYNTVVTRKYLDETWPFDSVNKSADQEILRVKFLNGLQITPETTLWTTASYLGSNKDVFVISENGDVYLTGKYVENLKVY